MIKICGITRIEDARAAAAAGADAVGFVFARSRRRIAPETAAAIDRNATGGCRRVGVFVDAAFDAIRRTVDVAALDVVQLHGAETDDDCRRIAALEVDVWKRLDVRADDTAERLAARGAGYAVAALLVDPGKGDGRSFRWPLVSRLAGPVIVAGGLAPDNVAAAIHATGAWGVDVSSGVEVEPGIKSEAKMTAFVDRARRAFEANEEGHHAT